MGITIGDSITFDSGVALANTFACFSTNDGMNRGLRCYKTTNDTGSTIYRVSGFALIYKDQSAKNANKTYLSEVSVTRDLTTSEMGTIASSPSKNIYGYLYDQLKTNYSSTTDVE
jgi:hypothetical protein